jgi:hypothetical protein
MGGDSARMIHPTRATAKDDPPVVDDCSAGDRSADDRHDREAADAHHGHDPAGADDHDDEAADNDDDQAAHDHHDPELVAGLVFLALLSRPPAPVT